MAQSVREVDPNELRLPPTRTGGADPWNLHQQIRQRGSSRDGRPFPAREGPTVGERDTRADLFAALQSLAELIPEMRAGQLVAAVGELCADLHGRGLWDASDAELLEAVWQFRRGCETATGPPAKPPSPGLQPTGPAASRSRRRNSRSRPGG